MRYLLLVLALMAVGCGSKKKKSAPPVTPPAPTVDYSAIVGQWDATCTSGAYVGSIESFRVSSTGRLVGWSALGPVDAQLESLGAGRFCATDGIVVVIDSAADTCDVNGGSSWALVAVALLHAG